ncbi:elongation factor Tu GTP-binding domain-containing protein 1-like protein [Dinothrombium tinctorium]|uniref:Elongation factor Tu GTP-binding domain-containing protein 1-like protein n=1 Tax=Dinothrombium tinctorium TaxID=1965070 RepID=A0A3S3PH77_9ACAR|nr:elongation factor Tu GTP-binding domain-containing protein 1-like protein [Dinothrombium tinctorium]RWS14440.1 elongation factor Tu GTP-binding domain-containing protein 1-like protein [Dinothrombium tinctorium]
MLPLHTCRRKDEKLQQILEQVNAFVGELFTADVLKESSKEPKASANESNEEEITYDWSSGLEEKDDSNVYFAPEQGNVVFASALDGWAFTINTFSNYLSKKMGINEKTLKMTLWGDFYLNSKTKKIMKGAQSKAKKPLFVSMVLENIWTVYEHIAMRRDKMMLEKIINSLNIQLSKRDLNHTDSRAQLQSVFSQWLPLSNSVLSAVCSLIPSPYELSEERVNLLMHSDSIKFETHHEEISKVRNAFKSCASGPDSQTIICVSKMFAIEKKFLPENRPRPLTAEEIALRREQIKLSKMSVNEEKENSGIVEEPFSVNNEEEKDENEDEFIAFARIFSGTVRKGDKLYVLGPKHNPYKIDSNLKVDPAKKLLDLSAEEHITVATIGNVYSLMGRDLELCEEVTAGNILGIGGLHDHIVKSATLSSTIYCPPFVDLHVISQPILRVAVEPQNPADILSLKKGLKLLNQADPCVEVKLQETGELVIATTGEIHLEKCIEDLQERFAKVPLNVSSPIVPFKETIVPPPKIDMVNEKIGESNVCRADAETNVNKEVTLMTPNKKLRVTIKAVPLPPEVTKLLESSEELLKILTNFRRAKANQMVTLSNETVQKLMNLKVQLSSLFQDEFWTPDLVDKILSFGPKHCGSNILLNLIENFKRPSLWNFESQSFSDSYSEYENYLLNGFQIATLAGPMCEEPMTGVCFVLKEWTMSEEVKTTESDPYGPFTGQIISTVKECCRKAFQAQPQRLVAAMYSCSIEVTSEVLGMFPLFNLFIKYINRVVTNICTSRG